MRIINELLSIILLTVWIDFKMIWILYLKYWIWNLINKIGSEKMSWINLNKFKIYERDLKSK